MNINNFKELNNGDFSKFNACLGNMYCNSESSFATMYMWQHFRNVKYCIENDTIFSLYKNHHGNYASFMPYGKKRNSHESLDYLLNLFSGLDSTLIINLCTEDFADFVISSGIYDVTVTETRNSFDYVYYTDDLINLHGKKYHGKKNHINSFEKKYAYEYVKYTASMKDECLKFCERILKSYYGDDKNDCYTELLSIKKTFENMDLFKLKCGLLKIDDNIIALSVGEKLNDEYALIHIEKADYNYRTAYSVINNMFLKNEFSDTIYVNREEDMGIEGLRNAKLSYHPCKMIKKYTLEIKGRK